MYQVAILSGLQYRVDDNPPFITTVLLGFQHYLMLLSSNLATPGIMAAVICAADGPDDVHVKTVLMGNMIFVCGLCTLVQTFFGARLPIVQCPAFAYIVPMIALSKVGRWQCPSANQAQMANISTMEMNATAGMDDQGVPLYVERMNMLTGSTMVAALLEIFIGATGIVSILMRYIGPLTVAPTIMLMGLSVAETGFTLAGKHWAISASTIVLIILFSEVIPVFKFRNPFRKNRHGHEERIEFVLHKLFSVILSTCIMWLVCFILTRVDAFPAIDEVNKYGHSARTDLRIDVIHETDWIRFPYPGYWGTPTFNSAMFVAMIAGVITSVIESIGDYYTCTRLAGAVPPPPHAINRGIMLEGIDCLLSTLFGAGFAVTSCSQNIGVISLTKVGSRRVVLMAGFLMMVFGCFSKFSALVVSMPDPIIGASFLVLFGVLAAVGASNLQFVDLNSSRNLLVFGISLFLGLSFPNWVVKNAALIHTGNDSLDQIINALLANHMFMGCFAALVLDNVIPEDHGKSDQHHGKIMEISWNFVEEGSDEERGIQIWRQVPDSSDGDSEDYDDNLYLTLKTYELPYISKYIQGWKWGKYVPFLPAFDGFDNKRCCRGKVEFEPAEKERVFYGDDDSCSIEEGKVKCSVEKLPV